MQTDTSNINFQLAVDFVQYTNRSIFLTGKAGTGKTTFLKYIKEHNDKNIAVVAPTGVAAINAGGVTIHSFFQLPFTPYIPANNLFNEQAEKATDKHQLLAKVRLNKERIKIIQKLELLIIDEISMVRCDVLDAIDQVLKSYRHQHSKPFGGLQVLLIGDMFQLPPVAKQDEWQILSQYYASPYFFDSMVIKECEPAFIELNKIYRQDDELFIDLLNKVRNSAVDEHAFELLQKHFNPQFEPSKDEGYITLTTHNARADAINSEALQSLSNPSFFYKAQVENSFPESMFPIDEVLEFKLGAQVMFLKNDTAKEKRFFNGKIGTIEQITNEDIWVKCSDSNDLIKVEKYKWENIVYTLNPQNNNVEEDVIGTFTQIPLRLAWAITIHKSQGLTFDKAIIDAGKAFAPGQVYVALSRCRTLDGIVLVSKIGNNNLFSDPHILQFSQLYKANQLQGSLSFEKHLHQNNVLNDLFEYEFEHDRVNKLSKFIEQHKNSFNQSARVFVNNLIEKIVYFRGVGKKFQTQLVELNDNQLLPNDNENLQSRFKEAAKWFSNKLKEVNEFINASTALTNDKENAKTYDELLKEMYQSLQEKQVIFSNLIDGFSLSKYQSIKKQFNPTGFNVSANAKKSSSGYRHATHPNLYNDLKQLRDEIAEQMNEQTFMIAGSKTLDELATYLPQTKAELNLITGFGSAKIKNYGREFLQIIIDYCSENNLTSLIHTKEKTKKAKIEKVEDVESVEEIKESKISTFDKSYNLFKEGKTIAEIAQERNMAITTIEGHLCKFIADGSIAIIEFIPVEKTAAIIKGLDGFEKGTSIIPFKEKLGDDVSYGELKMVIAHLDYIKSKEKKQETI